MTSTPAPVDLEELRAVAEKATKGPWEEFHGAYVNGPDGLLVCEMERIAYENAAYDAHYIATFDPPTVLALLSEIESLRSQLERVRGIATEEQQRAHEAEAEVASLRSDRDNETTKYEAARDVVEELCKRYGATVEWDSEGMAGLSMPRSSLTHLERVADAARDGATHAKQHRGPNANQPCPQCLAVLRPIAAAFNQEAPDGV